MAFSLWEYEMKCKTSEQHFKCTHWIAFVFAVIQLPKINHLCNNHQISQSSSQPSNNLASQSSVITSPEHSDSQPISHSPGIQQLKQSANQANYLASTYDFVLSCLILFYLILSCFVLALQWSSRQAGNSSLGSSGCLAGWLADWTADVLTDWLTGRLTIYIYIYLL